MNLNGDGKSLVFICASLGLLSAFKQLKHLITETHHNFCMLTLHTGKYSLALT